MSRERFELVRGKYEQALVRLHEAIDLDETEVVRDALIQRFEFTYELGWKAMFYCLKANLEKVPEMVKPVIQAAFKAGLIEDAQLWEQIKEYRDETSHTYNRDRAIEAAAFIRSDAIGAFDKLRDALQKAA